MSDPHDADDDPIETATATIGEAEPPDAEPDTQQPDDVAEEGKFASPDDFQPTRDGRGEREPMAGSIPGINGGEPRRVKMLPLNYGDMKSKLGDGAVHDVNEELLAGLFDKHVIEPDLAGISGHSRGRVTAEDINEMYPMDPRYLLEELFNISGIDAELMMQGARGEVEFTGN